MMRRREFLGLSGAALLMPAAAAPAGPFAPYTARFGDPGDRPILFLHGGPGSNAFSFEATAAQALAARGYRVVAFDQRGCGRSRPAPAGSRFDFAEAIADIEAIRAREALGRPTLMGHSFGGILALKYAEAHPDRVARVIMVATPLDFGATLQTIRRHARARYGTSNAAAIAYLDQIDAMAPASTDYAGYTFAHGIASGLYMVASPSPEAQARYQTALSGPGAALLTDSAPEPFVGFVRSEGYTTKSFAALAASVAARTECHAICGVEDGLFDVAEHARIRAAIGGHRLTLVPGASHLIFGDQQTAFLDIVDQAHARR